ncbi:branched-chain amino acid ABC transporter permease [Thalassospira lucentensis]|uniref:branched-chain amino acid ABC transporter permease n=1 Tax=Thalassospira lucentensis TaxID=168935 RepID=UPI003AA82E82
MDFAISATLNGLTLISILMLVGMGLAIIYGLMGIINMSHGDFITIGAFSLALVQGFGGSFWLALILAPFIGAVVGFAIEKSIVQFLYKRPLATIMATWGVSLIIQQSLQLIFGAAPQRVSAPITENIDLFGTPYPVYRLTLIAIAITIVWGTHFILKRTRFGLELRTVIQNPEMADSLGIDTKRVYAIAFSLATGLSAIAGVLLAPLTAVIAQMGVNYLARSFFVVIVGGAGGVPGVIAGSSFVGGLETVFNYAMPATMSQALVLILAIILVRFRPSGIVSR